tara:strand:- start:544 stop:858 length:315 start_codon:yes stop_codon:yes gene_type:complete
MSLKKQIIEILKTSPEFIDILNEFPMPPPDVIGKNIKPDGPVMDDNFEEPGNYGDLGMPIEIMELLQLYQSQYVQTRGKSGDTVLVSEIWDAIKDWARSKGATV